jgi:hypothetical protein
MSHSAGVSNLLSFGDASFTVLVGPPDNAKRFSLHKALAVNASAFFDSALRTTLVLASARF